MQHSQGERYGPGCQTNEVSWFTLITMSTYPGTLYLACAQNILISQKDIRLPDKKAD